MGLHPCRGFSLICPLLPSPELWGGIGADWFFPGLGPPVERGFLLIQPLRLWRFGYQVSSPKRKSNWKPPGCFHSMETWGRVRVSSWE